MGNATNSATARVLVTVFNSNGQQVLNETLAVPPSGHTAFTLINRYPTLGTGFEGTVELVSPTFEANYVGWAMRSDSSGVISSLPSGRYKSPTSHWDEIWMAFLKTLDVAKVAIGPIPVDLVISSDPEINARAQNGDTVQVTLALAELISDSPSELAFVVAHELGHIYQQRTGKFEFDINPERDADEWGVLLSLGAGYDPYAAAGVLSKLAMATGSADLIKQQFFENLLLVDAHGSFNQRIATAYSFIEAGCRSTPDVCSVVKSVYHPHFPASAPLMRVSAPERTRPGDENR